MPNPISAPEVTQWEEDPYADMPPKMRKFFAKPPRRIDPDAISTRRTKAIRQGKPKGWLAELCTLQHWLCAYCGFQMKKMRKGIVEPKTATLDHVLPISRGGRNQRSNLVAACSACNSAKGSMTAEEFREYLTASPDPLAPQSGSPQSSDPLPSAREDKRGGVRITEK